MNTPVDNASFLTLWSSRRHKFDDRVPLGMVGTQVNYQMMNRNVAKAKEEQRKSPDILGKSRLANRKQIIILKKVARFQVTGDTSLQTVLSYLGHHHIGFFRVLNYDCLFIKNHSPILFLQHDVKLHHNTYCLIVQKDRDHVQIILSDYTRSHSVY
jgi:hypothetical protein